MLGPTKTDAGVRTIVIPQVTIPDLEQVTAAALVHTRPELRTIYPPRDDHAPGIAQLCATSAPDQAVQLNRSQLEAEISPPPTRHNLNP